MFIMLAACALLQLLPAFAGFAGTGGVTPRFPAPAGETAAPAYADFIEDQFIDAFIPAAG
jgi:hypothetical protein